MKKRTFIGWMGKDDMVFEKCVGNPSDIITFFVRDRKIHNNEVNVKITIEPIRTKGRVK